MGIQKLFAPYDQEEKDEIYRFINQIFPSNPIFDFNIIVNGEIKTYTKNGRELDTVFIVCPTKKEKYKTKRIYENKLTFKDPSTHEVSMMNLKQNEEIEIGCFAFNLEIKSHDPSGIEIKGTNVEVKYTSGRQSASRKLRKQGDEAKKFIRKYCKHNIRYVNSFLYFPNTKKNDIKQKTKYEDLRYTILSSDTSLEDIIEGCIFEQGVDQYGEYNLPILGDRNYNLNKILEALEYFHKGVTPGKIELDNMEEYQKKYISKQSWTKNIGTKMIKLSGKAGTGKTTRLLRAGYDLFEEEYKSALFLTFNRALCADLGRMQWLLNIKTNGIRTQTIDKFLFGLCEEFGLYASYQVFEYDNKQNNKDKFIAIRELVLEQLEDDQICKRIKKALFRDYSYVLVDESQDWLDIEIDILMKIFDAKNIIIAWGDDQSIRRALPANWEKSAELNGFTTEPVPPVTTCMRSHSNLTKFAINLSKKLKISWQLKPSKDILGGKIYLFDKITNDLIQHFTKELHEQIEPYKPIDYLIIAAANTKKYNSIFWNLKNNNIEYWDAINTLERDRHPSSNQIRCVASETVRGLEAWSTMIFDIQLWLKHCEKVYLNHKQEIGQTSLLPDISKMEKSEIDYDTLDKWFLIPFTRAKQRLYIELPAEGTKMSKVLLGMSENSDYIDTKFILNK
tara:strand:- start:2633 stop:4660 length:2028 start_codon:yes stop_codon:yes gene_type:complete